MHDQDKVIRTGELKSGGSETPEPKPEAAW